MSKIALGIAVATAAAGAAVVFNQMQTNAQLRTQMADLRTLVQQQAKENAARPEAKAAPSPTPAPAGAETFGATEREEIAKLRTELTELKKQTKEFAARITQQVQAGGAAKPDPAAAIPTKLTRIAEMKNAGRGSPEATAETLFWSAAGGEVDALAGTLVFAEPVQAKAEAWFASLSESTRQQYGSPEKLIALMIARDAATLSGMQVIGQVPINDTDTAMRLRMGTDDGKVKDEKFLMRRGPDGWRVVLPENVVEKYARQLSGGKK